MTDQPYTVADLLAEAARQHKNAVEDPDFSGVGEQMEGHKIPSRGDFQWDQLAEDDFYKAMRAIDDLIGKAADVSRWAVDIGDDGLEPLDSVLSMQTTGGPLVRIHFAVRPNMPDDMRNALVEGLAMEIAKYLPETA